MAMGWVRKPYTDIREVYDDRGRGWPFSEFRIEGSYEWRNTSTFFFLEDENGDLIDDKEYLLLVDKDLFGKSGAAKIVVAPNWRVNLWIGTDNNNYWEDNSDMENIVQRDGLRRQDVIFATLDGNTGDYLSIDIDQQFSGINNFSLFVDGFARHNTSRKNINDEVRIAILSVEHYEELPDEVSGPLEEGGMGDIDNDGVPDGEDADPYDPDIQQPGDTDDDVPPTEDELTQEQQGQPGNGNGNGNGGNGNGGDEPEDQDDSIASLTDYLLLAAIVGIALVAILGIRME